jgi:hypothetical protein
MWTTVLVLAIAVNFEPTRIGLLTVALSRPRPLLQLLAFLCGSFAMTTSVGLLVLFVFHHGLFGEADFNGAKIQIAIGLFALAGAVLLATNVSMGRFSRKPLRGPVSDDPGWVAFQPASLRRLDRLSNRGRNLLQGGSPWFSGAMGVGIALPSIDYMALLVLIAASGATPVAQTSALLTFIIVGDIVVAIPIAGYLVAPERTRVLVGRFHDWVRARRRRDFAIVLAIAGCLMIAMGISRW